jgi:hypothetical protein
VASIRLAFEKQYDLGYCLAVFLVGDLAAAGAGASVDEEIEAGPRLGAGYGRPRRAESKEAS